MHKNVKQLYLYPSKFYTLLTIFSRLLVRWRVPSPGNYWIYRKILMPAASSIWTYYAPHKKNATNESLFILALPAYMDLPSPELLHHIHDLTILEPKYEKACV